MSTVLSYGEKALENYIRADLPKELEDTLLNEWNARVVDYDHERFPFADWILQRVRHYGHDVDDLKSVHEVLSEVEIYTLTKQLCADTNLPEFRNMVCDFVREVAVPKGAMKHPVAVQRFLNVRIMQPHKPQGIFPFHTGLLYGHGPASRSIWMPLTDVSADEDYTATMQILDVQKSRELIGQAIEKRLSVDEMTQLFGKHSWPLKTKPGQVVFFTQENIHGNFVNVTGKSRMSIDFRLAEGRFGDYLARKIAGGYFELIPEKSGTAFEKPAAGTFANGKPNIIYLANATPGTEGAPVHLQRYMVYEYCKKNDLHFQFELFELEAMSHLPTLHYILHELTSNVVLYSVYALPVNREFRTKILDAALDEGVIMHFVNENLVMRNAEDKKRIEALLDFAKYSA